MCKLRCGIGTVLIGQADEIPAHLVDLLASSGATTSAEALFVCIYALMLESGFYPVSEGVRGRCGKCSSPRTQ